MTDTHNRVVVIPAIGIGQILSWGASYYLPAVLVQPIARDTQWPTPWIVGALSVGLLISGLVSPRVGRLIERYGGRPILAGSAVLLAIGLILQGFAPGIEMMVAAWVVIGVGMGAGLYDPAFSTLARLYGDGARSAITQVTLFGGLASTVCWPLSAWFVEQFGWRGTSFAYAAIELAIVLPLYWFGVPREARAEPAPRPPAASPRARREDRFLLIVLGACMTLASVVMTVISVHLLAILQSRGLSLTEAVGLGMLIGPAQVGSRIIEAAFGRKHNPIWSLVVSTATVAIGLATLLGQVELIATGLILYGAGSGLRSIARGTVPLAMFGREGYAVLMGWLAMPVLIASALSPSLGDLLILHLGIRDTVVVLTALGVVTTGLAVILVPKALRRGMGAA